MGNSLNSEKKIVFDLIAGDEAAFSKLYTLYKTRLVYFALQFVKSQDIAEDVVQEAFISVWTSRQFINPNLPFGPYIYTIVKNRILNLLANLEREENLKKVLLSNSINSISGTDDFIAESELSDIIKKALDQLSPQQKVVFEMSRNEFKSRKEIAAILNISVNTVQQHISESLKIIRDFLKKYNMMFLFVLFL